MKYFVSQKWGIIELFQADNGLWETIDGTVFALRSDNNDKDKKDQCGIAPFAVPPGTLPSGVDIACRVHDYTYSSPAYQVFHTRQEADAYLEFLIASNKENGFWRVLGKPFRFIASLFGGFAWENSKTR